MLLTVTAAAAATKTNRSTVHRWLRAGLKFAWVEGKRMIDSADLAAFVPRPTGNPNFKSKKPEIGRDLKTVLLSVVPRQTGWWAESRNADKYQIFPNGYIASVAMLPRGLRSWRRGDPPLPRKAARALADMTGDKNWLNAGRKNILLTPAAARKFRRGRSA